MKGNWWAAPDGQQQQPVPLIKLNVSVIFTILGVLIEMLFFCAKNTF